MILPQTLCRPLLSHYSPCDLVIVISPHVLHLLSSLFLVLRLPSLMQYCGSLFDSVLVVSQVIPFSFVSFFWLIKDQSFEFSLVINLILLSVTIVFHNGRHPCIHCLTMLIKQFLSKILFFSPRFR